MTTTQASDPFDAGFCTLYALLPLCGLQKYKARTEAIEARIDKLMHQLPSLLGAVITRASASVVSTDGETTWDTVLNGAEEARARALRSGEPLLTADHVTWALPLFLVGPRILTEQIVHLRRWAMGVEEAEQLPSIYTDRLDLLEKYVRHAENQQQVFHHTSRHAHDRDYLMRIVRTVPELRDVCQSLEMP